MRKNKIAWLFIIIATTVKAQETVKMSLNEAIEYARKNQPLFQNYKVDQQISVSKKFETVSKFLPKINGSFDLRDNLRLPVIALKFPNPLTGVEQDMKIQQGTKYAGVGSLDLNQPLVDPAAIGDMRYYKQQTKLTGLQLEQALVDLKMNVSRAYYTALLNAERVKKNQKTVERNQRAYDDTKVKYDNQNALKTDLNRAYLNLQNSKYQLKVSTDSVRTSLTNLAQIIGLPVDSKFMLTDSLPGDIKTETLPEYPDVKAAENARIELRVENMQKSLNNLQLKKVNYQYMPSLSGYGNIGGTGYDNNNLFQKNSWYWSSYIGLKLTLPIFDGLQKTAQAQQQKLAIKKNENNIMNIRQSINYQLQTAIVNYANAANNLQLIQQNIALAEDVVKDVNTRYKNAMATYQDVLDAENTLKDTEFNYLQALYAFLLAELDWKKANGKL
jgi:outer membrane protein TolC